MRPGLIASLLLWALPAAPAAFAQFDPLLPSQRHLLVVAGIGGEDYYRDLFHRRALTLLDVARQHLAIADERITWLAESPQDDPQRIDGPSRKERVLAALADLAENAAPNDRILIVLIGHGTAGPGGILFNLPGPDLSASELATALDDLAGRQVAIINAAPASAPFVERLSGPGRIVITATSSSAENQHTLFADPFVEAFAIPAADGDKDGRVSLLEAFGYANREVERLYRLEGRIRTEYAQLDDNGDGVASREPDPESGDGALARRFHLAALGGGDGGGGGERLRLEIEARRLVDRIESLKRLKPALETEDYEDRLEALLIKLALNRRAMRGEGLP